MGLPVRVDAPHGVHLDAIDHLDPAELAMGPAAVDEDLDVVTVRQRFDGGLTRHDVEVPVLREEYAAAAQP